MKVSSNYIFRQVADEYLLIPVGEAALYTKGMISLSESGRLLYEALLSSCTYRNLVDVLLSEYEVDRATAEADVDAFLNKMRALHMLVEDET